MDLRVILFISSFLCFVVSDFRLVSMWTVTIQNQKLDKSTNSDNSETNCYTNLQIC